MPPALPPALSVVVPVKDEAENAAPLAREIAQALKGEPHEIIFVDDGSSDGTAEKLTALRAEIPQLRVLRHKRNLGQSRAVRSGVLAARADMIGTLDGDGQNDPADLPRLLAEMQRLNGSSGRNVAMVGGVRVKRQDTASRRMASKLGNGFRNWLLKDGAADTGCGIKVFRRDAYLELPYFDHQHRFLIALMRREGHGVGFLPVGHRPRLAGQSKYTNFGRMLVSINDLLGMRWLIRRHRGPAGTEEL
jgi:glycosyltransferase involved in cell wall biosynthesis